MYKQSSQSPIYTFPKISNIKAITTPKNYIKKINLNLKSESHSKNAICKKHCEPFLKYCKNCENDLCLYCSFTHDNKHLIINYEEIIPDENEINILKKNIKVIRNNYNKLLNEITTWKKLLDEKIFNFEKELEKNEILNNFHFIENFNNIEINSENIIKFRKIFKNIINPKINIEGKKNIEILGYVDKEENEENNMGYYNYNQYNISKAILDLLMNNINNNFINKGNLILKFLWDSLNNINNNINNNNNKKIIKNKRIYNTSTYCGSLRYDKDEDVFFNRNNNRNLSNKIIEKYIDLKKGSNNKINNLKKNQFISDININTNNYENDKSSTMYHTRTYTNSFSTSNILLNNIYSKNSKGILYSKKRCNLNSTNINNYERKLNQTDYNISPNLYDINNNTDKENNIFNKSDIENDLKYMGRSNSLKFINYKSFNNDKAQKEKKYSDKIITNKYIPKIRPKILINNNNQIFNTEYKHNKNNNINTINISMNKGKTFKHKKLDNNIELKITPEKEEEKLNQTELYNNNKSIDNLKEEPLNNSNIFNNSNILNNTFNQKYSANYYNNIIISNKKNQSNSNIQFITNSNSKNIINNEIKSSLFQQQNLNESSIQNPQKIQIRKNNKDSKYIINPNIPLCLSIELDNNELKLCFVNQITEEIELFPLSEDKYSIPMIISVNDKNEFIIGYEAEQMITLNPENTIFNLMKMIGKKFDEIKGMKELWPFKILKDENNRPFFWINLGKKNHKFYPEDLLTIYLKKIFKIFFKKVICDEISDDKMININLILVVCIPNNFTYFQRKITEKIFEKQIFLEQKEKDKINNDNINGKLYNNYIVNLKKIKLENISSIAGLCLKPYIDNKNKIKQAYSLIINIGGGHTNFSIVTSPFNKKKNHEIILDNKKIFGVKSLLGEELGFEDFTDYFMYDCLKEFNQNLYKKILETPSALAKLRMSCNLAQKSFDKKSSVEIKVSKLYDTIDLKMNLNKNEFEKVCENLYKKINNEIKKVIKEGKLSEINIENITLIGPISRGEKIKSLLKNLFKHNRLLYNKLSNSSIISNINNDFYPVIGGAIQSKNFLLSNNDKNQVLSLNDIIPMSFGVETINGKMEFIIEKGINVPIQKNKYVKIKNDGGKYLEIKIYEGEDNNVVNNKLISSANIDKRNFKYEKVGNNYIEILLQFEIDTDLNLCVYVLDVKTMKKRFECLINIDIIKN
jgi:L1 cell adhesion molecule like protein